MGDGLKLIKGKRHKSSSSLSGVLEGRLSTRKLDIRASIPELEDQFALAEARCDDLQKKIDVVKVMKRKKKLKKRSSTRMSDQKSSVEAIPLISVRTQPKKKVSQQATRHRRYEPPPHPTRGYLDPATVEQHRMIGQMHGYNQAYQQPQVRLAASPGPEHSRQASKRTPIVHPDGDAGIVRKPTHRLASVQISSGTQDAACSDLETAEFSETDDLFNQLQMSKNNNTVRNKKIADRQYSKSPSVIRRRHVPKETLVQEEMSKPARGNWAESSSVVRKQLPASKQQKDGLSVTEERSVIELFNKAHFRTNLSSAGRTAIQQIPTQKRKGRGVQNVKEIPDVTNNISTTPIKKDNHAKHPHRMKYHIRRYELSTVASRAKQGRMSYHQGTTNHTNIPFVVSKSTAPSHNIGVNIQQVLNGLKIKQPLSGIPLTIAHHMGLGHVPTYGHAKSTSHPSLDNTEMNAIKLGRRLVRLPSYKYNMSFNRLLALYREGDGMVPRFLRAISRPHYFYTSMYNLAAHYEDHDGATSKGLSGSQEAKQSLAEYAAMYRKYEDVDKCIKEGNRDPDLEQRRDELAKELANREEHIRTVVQEYGSQIEGDQAILRATASTTENPYRHSTIRLNVGDPQY